jgi:arylsulfatase A-like enzyme
LTAATQVFESKADITLSRRNVGFASIQAAVLDAVSKLPDADNTVIVYIVGDNGASAEGGIEGSTNENAFFNNISETWQDNIKVIDELGGPKHFNHFPAGWAWAMNTPFQWTKQVASHFGGTRNPMIISWPAKITDKGGLRSQFSHVIDIMPTLIEVAGIQAPDVLNGIAQRPIEGTSLAYTFGDAKAAERHKAQVFEIGVNRGIYQNGWFASSLSFPPWQADRKGFDVDKAKWELYNIDQDFSQADDLAAANPAKLRAMQDLWWAEAARNNILPLDWRGPERLSAELTGKPSLAGGRKTFVYRTSLAALPSRRSRP